MYKNCRFKRLGKVKSLLFCTLINCANYSPSFYYDSRYFAKPLCLSLDAHPLLIPSFISHFVNSVVSLIFILLTRNPKVKHSTKITHLLLCTLIDWANHLIPVHSTMNQSCESLLSNKKYWLGNFSVSLYSECIRLSTIDLTRC